MLCNAELQRGAPPAPGTAFLPRHASTTDLLSGHAVRGKRLMHPCARLPNQAEAKVLVESGPLLANASFIAIPEHTGGSAGMDASSGAVAAADTPSETPTKRPQHKARGP